MKIKELALVCCVAYSFIITHRPSFALEEVITDGNQILDEYSLHFSIEMPKRCIAGDLNAIFQDMMFADTSEKTHLLLSIQSLDGTKEYVSELPFDFEEPLFRSDPHEFLSKLAATTPTVDVKVEKPSSSQLFSITICKDSSGKKTCKRTSEDSYSDVMGLLHKYSSPPKDFVSPDSIYFYSLLTLGQSGPTLYDATTLLTQKGFSTLAATSGTDQETAMRQFQRAKKLYSLPLQAKNGAIVISLPVFDRHRCGSVTR